ncbi:MAG: copper amine oxidase N-terminal domain-containing protein [bacterium]|nr:copper amine oxidase N-terminal domain-containing protein [bacterium]
MKKKLSVALLSLAMFFNTYGLIGYAEDDISVTLNGETLAFDVPPQLIDNRTMVPLRKIFEAMGAEVDWNNDTQTVTATKGDERVIATINSKNVYVSGETKELDVPPMIIDDRTLVPVRFVAEAFGANVNWDEATKTVFINTEWDGIGKVPCYSKYSLVPDLGQILGIHGYEYTSDSSGAIYRYNLKDIPNLMPYVSAMEKSGFNVKAGAIDSILYTGVKNGIYVDVVLWDDVVDISITLPKNQILPTITSPNNGYYSHFGIKYKVPSDWKDPTVEEDAVYYYPVNGMMMVQHTDSVNIDFDENAFRQYLIGMSESVDDYNLISTGKTVLPNDNLKAYVAEFTGIMSDISINAKIICFQINNSIVTLCYSDFGASSNNMSQFDDIIKSISIE